MQIQSRQLLRAWKLFDWAAQPYFTLIATFLFPPFFVSALAVDQTDGQILWGWTVAIASLSVAILSPVIGHYSDKRRRIKPAFITTIIVAITSSFAIWYCVPGKTQSIYIASVAFIIATIGFEISTSLNNAMLPAIASQNNKEDLAWSGWALGSLSGLVVLFLFLGILVVAPFNIGSNIVITVTADDVVRFVGPFTSVWFAIFCIPIIYQYKDKGDRQDELIESSKKYSENQKYSRGYLFASMLLNDGLTALFAFGTIYAAAVFEWSLSQLLLLAIILTAAGYFGVIIGKLSGKRYGSRAIALFASAAILFAGMFVLGLERNRIFTMDATELNGFLLKNTSELAFVMLSVIIGGGSAALQSALRVMYLQYVSIKNAGKSFGLFAFSGKATTFIGPVLVALAIDHFQNIKAGMTAVLILIGAGVVLLRSVTSKIG